MELRSAQQHAWRSSREQMPALFQVDSVGERNQGNGEMTTTCGMCVAVVWEGWSWESEDGGRGEVVEGRGNGDR